LTKAVASMWAGSDKTSNIDECILKIIKRYSPETVERVVELVQREYKWSRSEILERVIQLQRLGKIVLKEAAPPSAFTLREYVFSSQTYWYWLTIVVSAITVVLVFTVPEDLYPIVYARHILGLIFVLWLPGYTFVRALFPRKELDIIERVALSIGMSMAIVPIVGLLLNYTPWGIRVTPITLSCLALTWVFATAAIIREYQRYESVVQF